MLYRHSGLIARKKIHSANLVTGLRQLARSERIYATPYTLITLCILRQSNINLRLLAWWLHFRILSRRQ